MAGNQRLAAALCALAAAAALFPTLGNGFTNWDDPRYILENPLIRSLSPASILRIFTTSEFSGNYHPLTLLAIAVQHALFGTAPFGYHLVSLLLHVVVTLLVYRITLGMPGAGGSPVVAFIAGLLFGIHPLHVEPVGWIADQKDLLYSALYLGAVLAYLRYRNSGDQGVLYRWVSPLFTLSLLSKALAVTLPVVLLLIDLRRDGRITAKALREKILLFVLSAGFGVMAIIAQSSAGALTTEGIDTPVEKLLYACKGYVLYIVKLAVPFGLSPWYPYPREVPGYYWLYAVIAVGTAAAAIAWRKRYPLVFLGLAWYTVTIAPVLQLVQVGNAEMAERYAYLPSVGILLIAGWGVSLALERFARSKPARTALLAAIVVYSLILASLSFSTVRVWRDGPTLWGRVVERFPETAKGWFNRGTALHNLGRYREALADYDRALAVNPAYPYAWSNRGITKLFLGEKEQALADLMHELRSRPDDPDVLFWRGSAFASLGRYDEAAADFTAVLRSRPGDFTATVRRGLVYTSARDYPKAEEDFNAAIALFPSEPGLYFNRGNVRAGMRRWDDAIADYSEVIRLAPGDRDAYYARGVAAFLRGDTAGACIDLRRASALGSAQADTAIAEICAK